MAERATLYFSFRSPYSWLLVHRLGRLADRLGDRVPVTFDRVPVYPPPGSALADAPPDSPKMRFIRREVREMATALGLPVAGEFSGDGDWARPHTAWLYCQEHGAGDAALAAFFAARFEAGRDICDPAEVRAIGTAVGLDGDAVLAAADDDAWRGRQLAGMRALLEDGCFGVPSIVWDGRVWWGNDRLDWFLRAVDAAAGRPVPDLAAAPFGPVWQPPAAD